MAAISVLLAVAFAQTAAPQQVDPVDAAAATAEAQAVAEAQAEAQQVDESATPVPTPLPVVQQPAPDVAPPPVQEAPSYAPPTYTPQSSGDRRIQLLSYDPDQIVTLPVSPGFASVIELGEDERVENVVVGNSAGWQVTANRRGDRVIVKPLGGAAQSNLIVLTGSRRYVFVLDPYGETSFIMRFRYPQAVAAAATVATAAGGAQQAYRFRGNKGLFPLAMSDDGRRTTIRFNEQGVMPAIFALNGRTEALVNGRMVGSDYVIEGAAPRYRFRYGTAEATAIRQTPKRRRR